MDRSADDLGGQLHHLSTDSADHHLIGRRQSGNAGTSRDRMSFDGV
jgi:hypothetical protein